MEDLPLLSEISEDLAARILSKVSFQDRFTGGRLRRHAGIIRAMAFNFEEVISLLNDQLPVIHVESLEKWVREVIRDVELAERIAQVACDQKDYMKIVLSVRSLMEERLRQCKNRRESN